jgi:hypothetical protein
MRTFLGIGVLCLSVAMVGCGDGSTGSKGSPGAGGSISGSGGNITTGVGGNAAIGTGTGGAVASGGSAVIGGGTGGAVGTGGSAAGGSGSGGTSKTDVGAGGADAADARIANPDQARAQADGTVGDNTCPTFEACGGDVVGTWYLRSQCLGDSPASYCRGYGVTFEAPEGAMVYTFNADGTFKISRTGVLRETAHYPIDCLHSDASAAQACSDLQDYVRQSLPGIADAGTSTTITSFTCSLDSEQACSCSEDLAGPATEVTGIYSINGNQITATALNATPMPDGGLGDAGAGQPADYCISGNTFRYGSVSSSGTVIVTMTK